MMVYFRRLEVFLVAPIMETSQGQVIFSFHFFNNLHVKISIFNELESVHIKKNTV